MGWPILQEQKLHGLHIDNVQYHSILTSNMLNLVRKQLPMANCSSEKKKYMHLGFYTSNDLQPVVR